MRVSDMLFFLHRSGLNLFLFLGCICGCGFEAVPAPDRYHEDQVSVVLTFDDGPVAADIPASTGAADRVALLLPLNRILAGLKKNNTTALFYIKGPGTPEAGETLKEVFTEGILSIHQANQILGYHAYNHANPIWDFPENMFAWNVEPMKEDLRQLKSFVGDLGKPEGLTGDALLTPVFRQPFGGMLMGISNGSRVARELGLTYHAYMIDSFDWTGHADADPALVARLPVGTEEDHVRFVRERLREKARAFSAAPVVDVLLHVNSFTAAHLQDWMDELRAAFEEFSGKSVVFAVPDIYLLDSRTVEDMSTLSFLF
jgi:peptidoglycan/xylan/chitin deacetylase (PgdA/CDA1 family)